MSLMVSPVSKLSFCAAPQVTDANKQQAAEDILGREGAFAKPAADPSKAPAPKKNSALKYIVGALVTAAVIAGSLYGLKNGFPNIFKVTENISDLKGLEKVKAYLTTTVAKGGEYVEKGASYLAEACKSGWETVTSKFKRS